MKSSPGNSIMAVFHDGVDSVVTRCSVFEATPGAESAQKSLRPGLGGWGFFCQGPLWNQATTRCHYSRRKYTGGICKAARL